MIVISILTLIEILPVSFKIWSRVAMSFCIGIFGSLLPQVDTIYYSLP